MQKLTEFLERKLKEIYNNMPTYPDWYSATCTCRDCARIRQGATPDPPRPKENWEQKMGRNGYNAVRLGFKNVTKDVQPNATYYGVELEVEYTGGYRSQTHVDQYEELEKKFGDFCLTKGDGSLRHGMEINSAPATLGAHKIFDWPTTLKLVRNAGFKAQSTCGMHVHVSRAPLGARGVERIARFIYNPENYGFIRFIAGRNSSRWARLRGVNADSLSSLFASGGYGGRYMALNLTNHETIEFRLFASTLQGHRFMSRLEFVGALAEFAKTDDEMTMDNFFAFVESKQRRYSNLMRKVKKFRLADEIIQRDGYKRRQSRSRFRSRNSSASS